MAKGEGRQVNKNGSGFQTDSNGCCFRHQQTSKHIRLYPPCKLKAEVPPELERICLKLLRKETSERYTNGLEVVSDLKDWLSPQLQPPTQVVQEPTKITPRGLRSFSDEDAGFFLDLLPGVRDREGLPEILSFWKKKIHQTDPEKTFSVGMMIGPSGCGKSSLVKAGIIPSLSKSIVAIHIDATTDETEAKRSKRC